MLSRLFKGKAKASLDHADAQARLQAVEQLEGSSAAAAQQQLAAMAASDPDDRVRHAAVQHLTDASSLAGLLVDKAVATAAATRLAALAAANEITLPLDMASHPLVVRARIASAAPEQAAELLRGIEDPAVLAEIALSVRSVRERLLELPALRSAAGLAALERASRDHDKSLNRHARDLLDQLKQVRAHCTTARERAAELTDALTRHQRALDKGQPVTPQFVDKQRSLLASLSATLEEYDRNARNLAGFGEIDPSVDALRAAHEQLTSTAALAQASVEAALQAAAEPAHVTLPTDDATTAAGDAAAELLLTADPEPRADRPRAINGAAFTELTCQFQALATDLKTPDDFAALSARRQALTEAWLMLADHQQPEPAQHQVFESASHAYAELADAVARLTATQWPELSLPPLADPATADDAATAALWPEAGRRCKLIHQAQRGVQALKWPQWASQQPAHAAVLESLGALEQEQARLQAFEHQQIERLNALITQLQEHVATGQLQPGMATLAEARRMDKQLAPGATRDAGKALNRCAAQLGELRDWQTFATSPKREHLRDAIQALVEQPLDPRDQSDRIKALRQEWQSLGPVSRGPDRKLADEFNALAEQAFEPCRAYFETLAEERRNNLAQREQICEQLAQYLDSADWRTVDLKAAEQILRTAREEWRRYHPVERNPGKALQDRFESLQSDLHNHIKAEWDRNLALKQTIVAEAQTLASNDGANDDRINGVKALQRRWREVGPTPRRPDQVLWAEFRAACDAVFDSRDQARQAEDAALASAQQAHDALQDELNARLETLTPETANVAELREFRNRFQNLPELPERLERALERRFQELTRSYAQVLEQQEQAGRKRELDELQAADEQVSSWEADYHGGSFQGDFQAPRAEFADRWQRLDDPIPLEHLHTLTLQAELKAGVESPAQDRERRLALQVEQLNKGLSGARLQEVDDPLALARAWCALGPKHAGTTALRSRFFAALRALMER